MRLDRHGQPRKAGMIECSTIESRMQSVTKRQIVASSRPFMHSLLLLHHHVLARRRWRIFTPLCMLTFLRTHRRGRILTRSILRLASTPPPRPQEPIDPFILPHAEITAPRRARRRDLLDLRSGWTDDGDRGVVDGEVFVLLEGISKGGETVVDQRGQVGYGSRNGSAGIGHSRIRFCSQSD